MGRKDGSVILPILLIAISPMGSIFAAVEARYAMISGPDSTVPVPETRITDRIAPDTASFFQDASFIVWRTDSTYLMVNIDTVPGPYLNLHVPPPGYYAQAARRDTGWEWLARSKAYTGYDVKAVAEDECLRNTVPCGLYVGGVWRLHPVRFRVLEAGIGGVRLQWNDSTRSYRP